MQVQKLAYFCHAWSLGLGFGHAWSLGLGFGPLFRDAVESCQQGPVIRSVSHALKPYGGDPITEPLSESAAVFSPAEDKIMAAVWDRYGVIDGLALSRMTHADGTPWHQTHSSDARTQIIHNDVIRDYYADILSEREN